MPDVKIKSLGDVPRNLDKRMSDFLNLVKHNLEVIGGTKGTIANKGVTFGDFSSTGIVGVVNLILGTENQVIVTDLGNGKIRLSTPQNTDLNADVEFDSATLDDLTALRLVSSSSLKRLISTDLTDWIAGTDLQPVNDDGDGTASLNDDELEFYIQAVA